MQVGTSYEGERGGANNISARLLMWDCYTVLSIEAATLDNSTVPLSQIDLSDVDLLKAWKMP